MSTHPSHRRGNARIQDNGLRWEGPTPNTGGAGVAKGRRGWKRLRSKADRRHKKRVRDHAQHKPSAGPARPECRTARLARQAIEMMLGRTRTLSHAELAALPTALSEAEYTAVMASGYYGYSEQWVVRYLVKEADGYWGERRMEFRTRDKWIELVPGDPDSVVSGHEVVEARFHELMAGAEYVLRRVDYQ